MISNIAEGFDSGSRPEFARFLNITRRSLSEIQSQLYVSLDQGYINKEKFNCVYADIEKLRKMIVSFIRYLNP